MTDDAVLAFDRGALVQRMLTGRIGFTGDAHGGVLASDVTTRAKSDSWAACLPRPEPLPPRAHPRMPTGDRERDIATLDAVRATTEHVVCSSLTSDRARTEQSKPRSRPGMCVTSGTYETERARRRKQVAAMGNGSPASAEWIPLKKLHPSSGAPAVLGVAIRLVRITQPFIEAWSWRPEWRRHDAELICGKST